MVRDQFHQHIHGHTLDLWFQSTKKNRDIQQGSNNISKVRSGWISYHEAWSWTMVARTGSLEASCLGHAARQRTDGSKHPTAHGIDQNLGNRTLVALTIGYLESRPFFSNKLPVGLMQNNKDENLHIPIINFLQSLVSKFSQNLITYLHKKSSVREQMCNFCSH